MILVVSRMEIFAAVEMLADCIETEVCGCKDPEEEEMERMTSDEVFCISSFVSRRIHYQTYPELEDPKSKSFLCQGYLALVAS